MKPAQKDCAICRGYGRPVLKIYSDGSVRLSNFECDHHEPPPPEMPRVIAGWRVQLDRRQ
jgi:hypothetical protein